VNTEDGNEVKVHTESQVVKNLDGNFLVGRDAYGMDVIEREGPRGHSNRE